ncbi:hypothetical protein QNH46_10110 [Paenibacillus woosongensis]|uniref:Uncharacterized protein n=1 Tax=Paenibacillus woosongensis TaxID=307580 RepID=A0AA95IAB5_9BACL|nr:hypothetical protein [Paenibacillus woosongensis]WHX50962.1 hypothetical protein QNH46_10110 [Paenibacillus woosongensis]
MIFVLGATALIITINGLSVPMKTAMTSSVEAESSEEAIPDIESSEFEKVKSWYASSEEKTRKVELTISC